MKTHEFLRGHYRIRKMYGINCAGFLIIATIMIMNIVGTLSVPIRLKGSKRDNEGRLEVFVNGRWGTVADTAFGRHDEATVVCRQLGYPFHGFATKSTVFGQGSGPIAYRSIKCDRYTYVPYDIEKCELLLADKFSQHIDDVGVVCARSSQPLFVELVGGSGPHEGRLEVQFGASGYMGSVCSSSGLSDDQGAILANLICSPLGYSAIAVVPVSSTNFTSMEGPIWVSELNCSHSAAYLHQCVVQWGRDNSNCSSHINDVAIICNSTRKTSDSIRLVGGSGGPEGRLEIEHNGQWGSVCSRSSLWKSRTIQGARSAKMICHQLGYGFGGYGDAESFETTSNVFGQGKGWIWTEGEFCSESHYFPCMYNASGISTGNDNCNHLHDVGIICNVSSPPPIRLVGGSEPNEGFAEIQFRGEWGTVCNKLDKYDQFDVENTAICRHLGYSGRDENETRSKSLYGPQQSQRIWLTHLMCLNNTARVDLCYFYPLGQDSCGYSTNRDDIDRRVVCEASTPAAPIRLVGGSGQREGRLEIFHGGEWGAICVEDYQKWGQNEANVACSQLGFNPVASYSNINSRSLATAGNIFANTSQKKINLDGVRCNSSRDYVLKDCEHSVWGGSGVCNNAKDVGVVCGVSSSFSSVIRLVGGLDGRRGFEGRLEVFFRGEWGTVCHDRKWTDYDKLPQVVCKQLGLGDGESQLTRAFGTGYLDRIWLEKVQCKGSESAIDYCQHSAWGGVTCDHTMDIGVRCNVTSATPVGLIVGLVFATLIVIFVIFGISRWKRMTNLMLGFSAKK